MFLSLSLDITLHILSYLTLPDIAKLYRLCCHTRRFLCDNEDAIYHQFAVRLHFVPQGCGLGELIAKNPVWLKDVKTWKDLYERWVVLNHNWSGRGTVTQGGYLWYGSDDVRYFKVDEQDQTVLAITATEPLTLTVRDIEDGTLFWCLEGVTKVELTDRFMLVWGRRQGVEIWRRANYAPHEKVRSSLRELSTLSVLPSQLQQSTPAFAPETIWAKRGVYVFHGFLRPTVGLPFLTYRFKGSLAAVVDTSEMHTVKLYNLEEGALVRSFDLNTIIHQNIGTQELRVEPASFVLLDIDLSTDHLCVAFDWALVVVPLEDAPAAGSVIVFSDRRAPLDVRRSGPRLVRSEDRGTSKSATCSVLDRKNKVFTIPSGAGSQETFTVALPNTSGTNLTPEDAWRPGAEWSPCFVSGMVSLW
ncbi:uncharacterized protein PHACADRAFT_165090 [Phanerochaete carnosa HHB-10118-sp]|uniref:F-box domain-containing protein n=1 Tax=Phanerochaete carnosa (strain HHB-10118-sp) TaxID=650164 RepID=K5VY71_PHACS|nr:uncharacterized protein PHACADRAFT_165090 [Phanerochaete carnosa HHB-10118-sp]EKM51760.1 hypothetical protein PHACADRAFT_165090 [Phanerochaete carnosa HHB-10118-sp]